MEEPRRFRRAAKLRLDRLEELKQAELLYPAPHRFADANGTAIGYDDEVVFPVKLTPEREGEPIELKLAFYYGLCKDLCVPNEVSLDLVLSPATERRCDTDRELPRPRAEASHARPVAGSERRRGEARR